VTVVVAVESDQLETIFKLLEHLAANRRVKRTKGAKIQQNIYQFLA
jgi:hypothetical protein